MAIMVKYKHIYDIPSDPALELQAHKDLSGPWVFGATSQAILTGIILFQCRQFFTVHARTRLSRGLKTYIGVLLFITVATCFIEMRVFWWFTMAISGQTSGKTWPVTLAVIFAVNPLNILACESGQIYAAYRATRRKRLFKAVFLPLFAGSTIAALAFGIVILLIYAKVTAITLLPAILAPASLGLDTLIYLLATGIRVTSTIQSSEWRLRMSICDHVQNLLTLGVLPTTTIAALTVVNAAGLFAQTSGVMLHTCTPRILTLAILLDLAVSLPIETEEEMQYRPDIRTLRSGGTLRKDRTDIVVV